MRDMRMSFLKASGQRSLQLLLRVAPMACAPGRTVSVGEADDHGDSVMLIRISDQVDGGREKVVQHAIWLEQHMTDDELRTRIIEPMLIGLGRF